jgi:hypothetical protein
MILNIYVSERKISTNKASADARSRQMVTVLDIKTLLLLYARSKFLLYFCRHCLWQPMRRRRPNLCSWHQIQSLFNESVEKSIQTNTYHRFFLEHWAQARLKLVRRLSPFTIAVLQRQYNLRSQQSVPPVYNWIRMTRRIVDWLGCWGCLTDHNGTYYCPETLPQSTQSNEVFYSTAQFDI